MTRPELAKYVKEWKRANQSVKNSFRATTEDIKKAAKQMHDDLKSKLMDMYTSLRDDAESQFGTIGDLIDPATYGKGLEEARANYASQMADFQSQIADLNQQLVDAQKEAAQRLADAIKSRKDELQQAFGQLFSGDWLSGAEVQTKLDWGQKLGFDDLMKDLQSQTDKFQHWRDALKTIAGKVPPELAKQLEDLGPDAVDKLDILNNATDDQLKQYVDVWSSGQASMQAVANQTTVDTSDITARMADITKQIADVMAQMSQLQYPKALTAGDIIKAITDQTSLWVNYGDLLQGLLDKGIPAGLIEQLSQMGPQAIPILEALNTITDTQLADLQTAWQEKEDAIEIGTIQHLNRQLQLWYDYGANIAHNIIAGISSQGAALHDYFEQLVISILEHNQIPVPHLGTGGVVNRPGLFQLAESGPEAVIPLDVWARNAIANSKAQPSANITVNQNITAHHDESLGTVLDRATFRMQNSLIT